MTESVNEYRTVNLEIKNLRERKGEANEQNNKVTITIYTALNLVLTFLKAKREKKIGV